MNAPSSPSSPSPALARLLASTADAVSAVRAGRSLTEALTRTPAALRPGTQALAFTVLRRLGTAQALRQRLAARQPPPEVEALLLCALALLWPTDEPPPYADHTLVNQAVGAVQRVAPTSAGFVNAVLRRFIRERDTWVSTLTTGPQADPVACWNHPRWWIDQLRRDWPAHWATLLAQAQRHPPMVLRVNRQRSSVATYQEALSAVGLSAVPLETSLWPDALCLTQPCPVERLPGFAEGWVSVQDASAQRAAALVLGHDAHALPPGARVLDACAAPGGKTAHLLEWRPDLDVLALDADAQRLRRVGDTLARLGLRARTQAADARRVADWWDGQPFDAILLDAPCSASGIVRRHPDIAWLRRAQDITALAHIQSELLDALWPLLKPGGRLVYATCSVFRAEGAAQVEAFVRRQSPGAVQVDSGAPGHVLMLPDNPTTAVADGFYYALLHSPAPIGAALGSA